MQKWEEFSTRSIQIYKSENLYCFETLLVLKVMILCVRRSSGERLKKKIEVIAQTFLLYRCILGKSDNVIILDEDSVIRTLYQYTLFIKGNKNQFRIKQKSYLNRIEAMLLKAPSLPQHLPGAPWQSLHFPVLFPTFKWGYWRPWC